MYGNDVLMDLACRISERGEVPKFAVYLFCPAVSGSSYGEYKLVELTDNYSEALDCLLGLELPILEEKGCCLAKISLAFGEKGIPSAEVAIRCWDVIICTPADWDDPETRELIVQVPYFWFYGLQLAQSYSGKRVIEDLSRYFSSNLQ